MVSYRTLVVLQATPFCNIDCEYCYLPQRSDTSRMSVDVVRRIASEVLSSDLVEPPLVFLWHLGEPLSAPISFYEEAFAAIRRANQDLRRAYSHSFQTNATLIDGRWVDLFLRNDVHLGVSVDGPAFIHDRKRVTRSGKGTHEAVLRGIKLLQAGSVPFSIISVLTDFSLDYPDEMFQFYVDNNLLDVGFNIDEIEGIHAKTSFALDRDRSVVRYRKFLHRLMKLSANRGGILKIREAWTNLRTLSMEENEPYNTTNQPFRILNFTSTGDFSTFCPELSGSRSPRHGDFVMGNVLYDGLADLITNPVFRLVREEIERGVAACKTSCAYWKFCGGGSPSNKFFEHGRFDVTETTTCRIHKQATVDVLLDFVEDHLATRRSLPVTSDLSSQQRHA